MPKLDLRLEALEQQNITRWTDDWYRFNTLRFGGLSSRAKQSIRAIDKTLLTEKMPKDVKLFLTEFMTIRKFNQLNKWHYQTEALEADAHGLCKDTAKVITEPDTSIYPSAIPSPPFELENIDNVLDQFNSKIENSEGNALMWLFLIYACIGILKAKTAY